MIEHNRSINSFVMQTYARSQIEQQIVEIRNIRFEWYVSIKTNKKNHYKILHSCIAEHIPAETKGYTENK